jgi:hypothetical protein
VSWSGYIRVDGTGYNFQGVNSNYTTAKTVGAYITPTRTIFTIDAGPVRLNLTYLTPIEVSVYVEDEGILLTAPKPNDWKLHSFPFAYMAINVWSTDSQPHRVQIYSDVSGRECAFILKGRTISTQSIIEFVSSNLGNAITWNTTQTPSGNSIYHRIQRTSMESLTENRGMSEDGALYFGAKAVSFFL